MPKFRFPSIRFDIRFIFPHSHRVFWRKESYTCILKIFSVEKILVAHLRIYMQIDSFLNFNGQCNQSYKKLLILFLPVVNRCSLRFVVWLKNEHRTILSEAEIYKSIFAESVINSRNFLIKRKLSEKRLLQSGLAQERASVLSKTLSFR